MLRTVLVGCAPVLTQYKARSKFSVIVAGLVLIGNLVSDLLYAVVDPRVRLE